MKASFLSALIIIFFLAGIIVYGHARQEDSDNFEKIIIDRHGPADPWGKSVGDVDGDGLQDLIVAGHAPRPPSLYKRILNRLNLGHYKWPQFGQLVWYQNPSWEKFLISDQYNFRTGVEVADIDGNGQSDVVAVADQGLFWFRGPHWQPFLIDERRLHDIEIYDLDEDGDLDIVARNQSLFGANNGDTIHVYRQDGAYQWLHFSIASPHGEGLLVLDVDQDGWADIVGNQFWFQNPRVLSPDREWVPNSYCSSWDWSDAFLDSGDLNHDGRPDILMSPAEIAGERYRVSWCDVTAENARDGREHIIDNDVEAVIHSIRAGDFNGDGSLDVVTAQMYQGQDPDVVSVYWNNDLGESWKKDTISSRGSHSMRVLDVDQDGVSEFFGANWEGPYQAIELWKKKMTGAVLPVPEWRRHVITDTKPWRTPFVLVADIDADGRKDLVCGNRWYRNPGSFSRQWEAVSLGTSVNNAAAVLDIDQDGDLDIFASTWNQPREWTFSERFLRQIRLRKYYRHGELIWSENDGKGNFIAHPGVVPSGHGDFLQGIGVIGKEQGRQIILSWHHSDQGLDRIQIPEDPDSEPWRLRTLPGRSQDEAISIADLDTDGDQDIVLGTLWLRNDGLDSWQQFRLFDTTASPDRNRVADINTDGIPDVVIGYEAVSKYGRLAWYQRGERSEALWQEHEIATLTGPMSIDVADLDADGDMDVIVGEHDLVSPATARLIWFENLDADGLCWKQHVIHVGDEHHDGAQVVDIDDDGDLDVISIGWGHDRLIVYENLAI